MKSADPVMQEVWQAKAASAKKHGSLAAYLAHLRKQSKRKHPAGRAPAVEDKAAKGSVKN